MSLVGSSIVLDGKSIAERVRSNVAAEVSAFRAKYGRPPSLHVILANDVPASAVYVRNKEKAAQEVGIHGVVERMSQASTEAEIAARVSALSADPLVDGILVQLPLPRGVREEVVLGLVDPKKDVDGFHPVNVGLLSVGRSDALVACTPLGCLVLIDEAIRLLAEQGRSFSLAGARAVVVGRSNIVGKPVAQLLLARHATVTIAHSRTKELAAVCREADVLVAAVGRKEMITGDFVKEGAIVIDVGINEVEREGKKRLVGDVDFASVAGKSAAITPVPKGVGPMTIAMLLQNTVRAAAARQ